MKATASSSQETDMTIDDELIELVEVELQEIPHATIDPSAKTRLLKELRKMKEQKEHTLFLTKEIGDFLTKLTLKTEKSKLEVVKMGLILIGILLKAKEQNYHMAIVDNDGNILSTIDGL